MWDPCSGKCSLQSRGRFLPEVVEGLDGSVATGKSGGKTNEYTLAVINERCKGRIEEHKK